MEEQKIGEIFGYYAKIGVAAIKLNDGSLKVGDKIHIKGHTTDFEQTVDSMQIEHDKVQEAKKGSDVGIKVKDTVRPGDVVYK
ncbi:translation elongation factor-like protein [archaeon]|nr:translation elongation factor-like protein [archaeon]